MVSWSPRSWCSGLRRADSWSPCLQYDFVSVVFGALSNSNSKPTEQHYPRAVAMPLCPNKAGFEREPGPPWSPSKRVAEALIRSWAQLHFRNDRPTAWSSRAPTQTPGRIQKGRSTLGFYKLHHRAQNWGFHFLDPPRGLGIDIWDVAFFGGLHDQSHCFLAWPMGRWQGKKPCAAFQTPELKTAAWASFARCGS